MPIWLQKYARNLFLRLLWCGTDNLQFIVEMFARLGYTISRRYRDNRYAFYRAEMEDVADDWRIWCLKFSLCYKRM